MIDPLKVSTANIIIVIIIVVVIIVIIIVSIVIESVDIQVDNDIHPQGHYIITEVKSTYFSPDIKKPTSFNWHSIADTPKFA